MTTVPVLRLEGLRKSFHGNVLLAAIHLDPPAPHVLALIGPSGLGQ